MSALSKFIVTDSIHIQDTEEVVSALHALVQGRFKAGRAIGKAEAEDEITRLRSHLKAIADHHEAERDKSEFAHMDAAARYHEQRRDVAMFPLIVQTQGEPLPMELAG